MITDENLAAIPPLIANQCRDFLAAAQVAIGQRGEGASAAASSGEQARNLASWASDNGKLIAAPQFESLALISNETSEHEVRRRESDDRAIKRTWAGVYGQIPSPENGKLGRRNATPAEYLLRMALQGVVFGSDLRFEGVSISDKPSMIIGQPPGEPSMVISQPWFVKQGTVRMEDIRELMEGEGFEAVSGAYFGWYRKGDGVAVVDAKPDNFISTECGVIPIDLQIAILSNDEAENAGLLFK